MAKLSGTSSKSWVWGSRTVNGVPTAGSACDSAALVIFRSDKTFSYSLPASATRCGFPGTITGVYKVINDNQLLLSVFNGSTTTTDTSTLAKIDDTSLQVSKTTNGTTTLNTLIKK